MPGALNPTHLHVALKDIQSNVGKKAATVAATSSGSSAQFADLRFIVASLFVLIVVCF